MKKLVLLTAILLTIRLSFAADTSSAISPAINSFHGDFYKATDVQWQRSSTYERVSFYLDSRFMNAYYTPDGDLIAITSNIVSEQLPLKLLLDLKKNYAGLWISDLFEVVNGTDDQYYVTLENADEKLILKSGAHKSWKVYKKIVKL